MWMPVRSFLVILLVAAPALSLTPHPREAEPDRTLYSQLPRVLPELTFCDCTFGDAIDLLSDLTSHGIEVDWRGLARVGITRSTFVSARMRGKRFDQALTAVLDSAAGGPGVLAFDTSKDGVIRVSRAWRVPAVNWKIPLGVAMAALIGYSLCSHPRGSSGSRPDSV